MLEEKIFVTRSSLPPYEEYVKAIKPLWESHWLTNMGKYHQELENELGDYLKVKKLSLTVNGHMALELAIQSFGFPEGGEVITTPFTFISTTHAIVRNRLRPVFCDVKAEDGTIDETKIEGLITERTVAILPVHVYGHICDVEAIRRIADRYGLKIIYDAAHAFGVSYLGQGIGNYGDASIFSFHATKVFHTIEGGAVVFSDPAQYETLYNLKNFGIRNEEVVEGVGANAKMNEFCAIMGLCNLNYLEEELEKRKRIVEFYERRMKDIAGIRILKGRSGATQNYAYFPVLVEGDYWTDRNGLYDLLKKNHIFTRKYFYPLTVDQECFRGKYENDALECARYLSDRVLVLPLYADLDMAGAERVIRIIGGT